jgi:hypothetical protein
VLISVHKCHITSFDSSTLSPSPLLLSPSLPLLLSSYLISPLLYFPHVLLLYSSLIKIYFVGNFMSSPFTIRCSTLLSLLLSSCHPHHPTLLVSSLLYRLTLTVTLPVTLTSITVCTSILVLNNYSTSFLYFNNNNNNNNNSNLT